MLAILLYVAALVILGLLVLAVLDYRQGVKRRQAKLDHEYRMKQLEQEERWLEVAESEHENE
ncbi:hypothetical protein HRTV-25_gp63 [Halorubrum tailed virus 25]|uniref:Uncharacterized protein n=1 Tax=Halorubrum tailed virus 25 TaxID=2878006 RepID=A0AAE9BY90_9CAUD|nr:hypothetical protein M1M37_gp063 [Halorubrum tailed virus 25]UBF22644.1 hypothetical protein HRTV-25_gp63 [Halorubrum tailed virus 25]